MPCCGFNPKWLLSELTPRRIKRCLSTLSTCLLLSVGAVLVFWGFSIRVGGEDDAGGRRIIVAGAGLLAASCCPFCLLRCEKTEWRDWEAPVNFVSIIWEEVWYPKAKLPPLEYLKVRCCSLLSLLLLAGGGALIGLSVKQGLDGDPQALRMLVGGVVSLACFVGIVCLPLCMGIRRVDNREGKAVRVDRPPGIRGGPRVTVPSASARVGRRPFQEQTSIAVSVPVLAQPSAPSPSLPEAEAPDSPVDLSAAF